MNALATSYEKIIDVIASIYCMAMSFAVVQCGGFLRESQCDIASR